MIFEAFILTAGLSSRMGKSNKLLLKYKEKTVVEETLSNVEKSKINKISIITGHQSEEVSIKIKSKNISFIHNEDYKSGILSSIKIVSDNVQQETDGILIVLGDMPEVRPKDINSLIDNFEKEKGKFICIPIFDNKRGNPVLFPYNIFKKIILDLKDINFDHGLRNVIDSYAYKEISASSGVLMDFDTEDDFI
ncbi:MAG: nucleotidyltransferase family protein [Pseudomonadota bacterium]|nr:nucleotidyltransferase family protein [Pseudomonadota bacterium]MEE3294706.1 nucleotidyltransferase family protein [Pseudomonadota bacterium]|tara:strand:+ start:4937 stop:5515 length:579 start_codon:yes stop_codon:yes gene_type:complete